MEIIIEKACPADAAALLDYLRRVGGETDNLTFGAEGLPFTVEQEEAFLASMQRSADSVMLVAKEDGQIVGNAGLTRLPRRMSHRGDVALSVAGSHWNRGIGGRLLAELIRFARENAFEILELQVRSDNLPAIHLYEKYGFRAFATHPAFFKMDGKPIEFVYMYLTVSE